MTRVLALAMLVLAAGCAPKDFSKEGKSSEQMIDDEQQCRRQVTAQARRQRDIADQRRVVFEGERERYGQQDLYVTMDNQGDKNNFNRMVAQCMEARGWEPRNQNGVVTWWNRVSTFNTPLGK